MKSLTLLLAAVIGVGTAQARELRVGSAAYPTIQSAVDAAQPGDTVLLARDRPAYFESIMFRNRSGAQGAPIILDGQGAVLDGSEVLRPEEWREVSPGLFRSTALPARLKMEPAILMRYFFVFNGEANRMGHSSKGMQTPYKAWQALEPGEWTYTADERAFYLRPNPGQGLDTVRAPILGAAVSLDGNCEWLRIRNLTATRFWNDGFNIHGRSREVQFSNIKALDCGDDGISAHEDCEISVDGLVSRGNATGFCHIGQSRTRSRNVFIENCVSYGVFLLDASHHELENCVIRSRSGSALSLLNGTELIMKNVLIAGTATTQAGMVVASGSRLAAHNASIWDLPFTVTGAAASWFQSVAAGTGNRVTVDARSTWTGDGNLWDVDAVRWTDVVLERRTSGTFQFAGQEANSRARSLSAEEVLKGGLAPYGFDTEKVPWYPAGEPYTD